MDSPVYTCIRSSHMYGLEQKSGVVKQYHNTITSNAISADKVCVNSLYMGECGKTYTYVTYTNIFLGKCSTSLKHEIK